MSISNRRSLRNGERGSNPETQRHSAALWPQPKQDANTERERRLSSSFIEPVTWCDGQKGFAHSKGLTHHVNGEAAEGSPRPRRRSAPVDRPLVARSSPFSPRVFCDLRVGVFFLLAALSGFGGRDGKSARPSY